MKALALLTAVTVTLFSVAASAQTSGAPTARAKLLRHRLLPKARLALEGTSHCAGPLCFWDRTRRYYEAEADVFDPAAYPIGNARPNGAWPRG